MSLTWPVCDGDGHLAVSRVPPLPQPSSWSLSPGPSAVHVSARPFCLFAFQMRRPLACDATTGRSGFRGADRQHPGPDCSPARRKTALFSVFVGVLPLAGQTAHRDSVPCRDPWRPVWARTGSRCVDRYSAVLQRERTVSLSLLVE